MASSGQRADWGETLCKGTEIEMQKARAENKKKKKTNKFLVVNILHNPDRSAHAAPRSSAG
jgi:hypothetical protein